MVIWLTGLQGSGKTTISKALMKALRDKRKNVVILDGDQIRDALGNFEYDVNSRKLLSRTYAKLSEFISQQDTFVICATVSMFHSVREWNRENIKDYYEIYVKTPPHILKKRNQKSLLSQASQSQIKYVHGFDIEIEEPKYPDLIIENDGAHSIDSLVKHILKEMNL